MCSCSRSGDSAHALSSERRNKCTDTEGHLVTGVGTSHTYSPVSPWSFWGLCAWHGRRHSGKGSGKWTPRIPEMNPAGQAGTVTTGALFLVSHRRGACGLEHWLPEGPASLIHSQVSQTPWGPWKPKVKMWSPYILPRGSFLVIGRHRGPCGSCLRTSPVRKWG